MTIVAELEESWKLSIGQPLVENKQEPSGSSQTMKKSLGLLLYEDDKSSDHQSCSTNPERDDEEWIDYEAESCDKSIPTSVFGSMISDDQMNTQQNRSFR